MIQSLLTLIAMNKRTKYLGFILTCLSITSASAQGAESISTTNAFYLVSGFVFIVALLVLAVSVVVLRLLKVLVKQETERLAEAKGVVF